MTKVLIQGGRIVTAVDDYVADILIEDGEQWRGRDGMGQYLSRSASGGVL